MSTTQAHIHPLHHKKGKKRLSNVSPGNASRITECGSNPSINYTGIMEHGCQLSCFTWSVAGNCSVQGLTYWPHEYT